MDEPTLDESTVEEPTEPTPGRNKWLLAAVVVLVVAAAGAVVFLGVGRWLVVQDPLGQADVIVILSGQMPARALQAAHIFQSGDASRVWISQGESPTEELKAMNIVYLGDDFYNEKVLLAQRVPLDAITILDTPIANTEEEVREISAEMRRENFHTAILVTSKPHTRRVRTIWHKLAPADLQAIVRYTDDDSYDGAHWWRHTHDALDVSREVLGLVNAWAGFPVRPSQN